MKLKLAEAGDAYTVNVWDDKGKLCVSLVFPSTDHRDAAIDALQKMLDVARSVKRI